MSKQDRGQAGKQNILICHDVAWRAGQQREQEDRACGTSRSGLRVVQEEGGPGANPPPRSSGARPGRREASLEEQGTF